MECGECTVCCTLSVVPELGKKAGEQCMHCDGGCNIYGNHPQSCKDFNCAWVQHDGKFSSKEVKEQYLKLRPDRCGTMFFKKSDTIFCGAVMTDQQVTDLARQQIESFKEQGYSVVMLKIGEKPYVLPVSELSATEVYSEYVETLMNGDL